MLKLTVSQDGSGDFASISEAVLAVPYELEAEICIGPGIYREKLVCEKRALTLRGAGADATTLIFGDGGKLPHPDGRPTHTFRSYTAFFQRRQRNGGGSDHCQRCRPGQCRGAGHCRLCGC